jgi:hypothetical protein
MDAPRGVNARIPVQDPSHHARGRNEELPMKRILQICAVAALAALTGCAIVPAYPPDYGAGGPGYGVGVVAPGPAYGIAAPYGFVAPFPFYYRSHGGYRSSPGYRHRR